MLPLTGFPSFMFEADPSPGLLPRLLAPFARRDLTPHRMWSHLGRDGMHVEIALEAAPETDVAMVAGNLGQVVGVRSVVQVRGNMVHRAA